MKLSEVIKALSLYETYMRFLLAGTSSDKTMSDMWDEYYDYQQRISREIGYVWSLHNVITNVHYNEKVKDKDKIRVLVNVLKAMNIEVIDDGRNEQ